MTTAVLAKLLAMFFTVALGWVAGRQGWLGQLETRAEAAEPKQTAPTSEADPARVLGNVAFFIFVPALLFRTTARLDLAHMPWRTLAAFFVPVLAILFVVYLWQRRQAARLGAAAPAVRAITCTFGNSVQVGIPFAAALFGEAGLAIHIALVSLHALVLLTVLTLLVEMDLARDPARHAQAPALLRTLGTTARNTIVHPVVLPVLAGLAWNLTGLGLHPVVDESLATLATAVVPVCLVLIGVTLAAYGVRGQWRGALGICLVKLLLLPATVLALAHFAFGLTGLPLAVLVVMAALPAGSNSLIFAQRYGTLQAETTAAIVLSTVLFAVTASGWLAVLKLVAP
ncbi:MAG: AEC family transporter [Leptothrix sp. (in: Bacteria)]|nr:AEC family transporter [Leptothrix sp. (in: b-proteobacteria)]